MSVGSIINFYIYCVVIGFIFQILAMKRTMSGEGLRHVCRIFGKSVISTYNYDGVKGKKPLKRFQNILDALYGKKHTIIYVPSRQL